MKTENKYTIDAAGKTLGRLATEVAAILLAKNSSSFAKNFAANVKVTVTNAAKVVVTGNKMESKTHSQLYVDFWYSQFSV